MVSGQLADRLGRRPVFLITSVIIILCVFAAAFVTDYASYAVVRFVTGLAMAAMVGSHCVMTMELATRDLRAAFGTLSALPYAFGIMLVAAGSYAIRSHRSLQLAYAVPFLTLLPNFWLRPESPHWLVVQGRFSEAYTILERGARCNRRRMPPREDVLKMMRRARDGLLAREEAARRSGSGGQEGLAAAGQLASADPLHPGVRLHQLRDRRLLLRHDLRHDAAELEPAPGRRALRARRDPVLLRVPTTQPARPPDLPDSLPSHRRRCHVPRLRRPTSNTLADSRLSGQVLRVGGLRRRSGVLINECMPTTVRGLAFGVSNMGGAAGRGDHSVRGGPGERPASAAAPSAVFGGAVLLAGLAGFLLPETNNKPLPETAADIQSRSGGETDGG